VRITLSKRYVVEIKKRLESVRLKKGEKKRNLNRIIKN